MADKETKSSDDAQPLQPGLSASALLKEHEKMMKAKRDKKRLQEASRDSNADGRRLTNTCVPDVITTGSSQCSSSDVVTCNAVESKRVRDAAVAEPELAEQHGRSNKHVEQEPGQTSKHVVKPQLRVPELGRGLNVSCGGFVDLDGDECLSTPSTVTADSSKVG